MNHLPRVLFTAACVVAAAGLSTRGLVAQEPKAAMSAGSQALHMSMEKGHEVWLKDHKPAAAGHAH